MITLSDELRANADVTHSPNTAGLLRRVAETIEGLHRASRKKCIVKGCTNHSDEGLFHGEMCMPCYKMITEGVFSCGNTIFHDLEHKREQAEDFIATTYGVVLQGAKKYWGEHYGKE